MFGYRWAIRPISTCVLGSSVTDITFQGAVPKGTHVFSLPLSRHLRAGLLHSMPAALEFGYLAYSVLYSSSFLSLSERRSLVRFEIESQWTARKREKLGIFPTAKIRQMTTKAPPKRSLDGAPSRLDIDWTAARPSLKRLGFVPFPLPRHLRAGLSRSAPAALLCIRSY